MASVAELTPIDEFGVWQYGEACFGWFMATIPRGKAALAANEAKTITDFG